MSTHDFKLSIKFLKAGAGDAILIRYYGTTNRFYNVLVDGGSGMAYPQNLKKEVLSLPEGERLDLVIVTHHDDDHAKGIQRLLKDANGRIFKEGLIGELWINALLDSTESTTAIGARTAMNISSRIQEVGAKEAGFKILAGQVYEYGGAVLQIVSPTIEIRGKWENYFEAELKKLDERRISGTMKECDYATQLDQILRGKEVKDGSISNAASIAFILNVGSFRGLFLGDAWADVVADELKKLGFTEDNPLEVNVMKLSHHGAITNVSSNLLNLVRAKEYIISSEGRKWCKPSKRAIGKILGSIHYKEQNRFVFNYESGNYSELFTAEESSALNLKFCNCERGYLWKEEK